MGRRGRIQYRLTGSYTRQGYFSFVPQLIEGLERLWVLKGPAGSGKSGFIRALGENLADQGYEVEFWLSAMEPGSAEGIFMPHLNAAVVNGSLPQPVDPPFPGVNGELINLGEGFKGERIEEWHQELVSMAARILHYNRLAENLIENSACLEDSCIEVQRSKIDREKLSRTMDEIEDSIFEAPAKERHFYACSLTVDGLMDYVQELSRDCRKRFVLHGPPGCGQQEIFARLIKKARQRGMNIEHYHWALDPEKTCLILIPQLKTALLQDAYLSLAEQPGDVIIDMAALLREDPEFEPSDYRRRSETLLMQVQVELEEVYKTFRELKRIQAEAVEQAWMDMQREEISRKITRRLDYR